jgi:hypothetical protein
VADDESRRVEGEAPGGDSGRGSWLRPAALFLVSLGLSTFEPTVLVGIPFMILVLVFPSTRLPVLVTGAFAAVLVFGGATREGLWFAERGWAVLVGGWFVTLTLRWPESSFTHRGVGAVTGAAGVAATVMAVQPGSWAVLDWLVDERIRSGVATALEAYRLVQGEEGAVSPAVVATLYQTAEAQAMVFPALVALASLASLGVAWWVYLRLARDDRSALGPVAEFRFSDQLVWLFLGGLGLLVAGAGESLTRAGSNAVVFMGALYALRGAAVVLFVNGGLSFFGVAFVVVGLLLAAPVLLVAALVVGLGDTWLDLRGRARELMA